MCKVLIFGGTTEGRILAEYCSENRIPAYVSVVTDYGSKLLPEDLFIKTVTGAMDSGEIRTFLENHGIELVVDATHPYARNVTGNIKAACLDTKTAYLRYLREGRGGENRGEEKKAVDMEKQGCVFSTAGEAADWLEGTDGTIFVTTGSNELERFAGSEKLRERIYVRVLPSASAVSKCEELGIAGARLICMQGPFTKEMNVAMLRHVNAAYLVTKEAGTAGGFEEKIQAAKECGVSVVVISRPEETGDSSDEIYTQLNRFSVRNTPQERRRVVLAGIGPGAASLMTEEVKEAILASDFLVGAPRMLNAAALLRSREEGRTGERRMPAVKAAYQDSEVMAALRLHRDWQQAVILYSGDSGFFSGAGMLTVRLMERGYQFSVLPGISSVSYFAAKLATSWSGAMTATAHGRDFDVCAALKAGNRKIFLLTGGKNGVGEICRELENNGYGEARVTVGENLSYRDEKITCRTAGELSGRAFAPLSLMLIEPQNAIWENKGIIQ